MKKANNNKNSIDIVSYLETIEEDNFFNFRPLTQSKNSLIEYKVKGLNALDIKNILQTTLDTNIISGTKFNKLINSLLRASLPDNYSELTVLDRILFILQARANAIGEDIKDHNGEVIARIPQIIQSIFDAASKIDLSEFQHYEDEVIAFTLCVPTLVVDEEMDDCSINVVQKLQRSLNDEQTTNNSEQLAKLVGEALIVELAKHIEVITFKKIDKTVKFSDITETDRIAIIGKLPGKAVVSIMSFAEKFRTIYEPFLKIGNIQIPINGSLFFTKLPET